MVGFVSDIHRSSLYSVHAVTTLPCRGAFCTFLLADYSPRLVPSSNAFNLRSNSRHCVQCRVMGAAAQRMMCVLIHRIDTWDLKGDPSKGPRTSMCSCPACVLPRLSLRVASYPLKVCSAIMPLSPRA